MESRAHLQQRGDPPAQPGDPLGRLDDPAEDLQQRRFAGAVAADEPDDLAPLDLEARRSAVPRTSCRYGSPPA